MKAIILAAGQGMRLKKYTHNLPKGMLCFMGKTIIERQIAVYRSMGIEDIIIVRGYAAEKISYAGIKYYDNDRYAETNMVESLLTAKDEFTDDAVISYSDILFEEQMLRKMIYAKGDFTCAVDLNWKEYWKKRYGRIDFDTESLSINEKGNIIELGLEDPPIERINARYIGLLKISRGGLEFISSMMQEAYRDFGDNAWQQSGKSVREAYMTDLLNAVIQSGRLVRAVCFENGWIEFDTNDDYEKAVKWAEDGSLGDIIQL